MKYPLTFYVKSLPPDVGGCANAFIIRILEKYKGKDEGIYQHELEHVRQWFLFFTVGVMSAVLWYKLGNVEYALWSLVIGFAAHSVLYMVSNYYKLFCEEQAYRVQLKYYPDNRTKLFASFIANYYKLDISPEEAEQMLRG